MSMVVVVVSSEQVVKPRSRRAVVKPEVLPVTRAILSIYTKYLYEFGKLKMGVVLIKWMWPKKFRNPTIVIILDPPLDATNKLEFQ